jgi:hypothetical protein
MKEEASDEYIELLTSEELAIEKPRPIGIGGLSQTLFD